MTFFKFSALNKGFVPTDPYINDVALLLRGNGADESPRPKSVGTFGSATLHNTSQSKFGGSSCGFGGYFSVPYSADYNFGTNDFTIDTWMWMSAANNTGSSVQSLCCRQPAGTGMVLQWYYNSSGFQVLFRNADGSGLTWSGTNPTMPTSNAWTHVELDRHGNFVTLFVNGVGVTTNMGQTHNLANSSQRFLIGAQDDVTPYQVFQGYMDDFRITNGVARNTSNFTPPIYEAPIA